MTLLTWPEYVSPATLAAFRQATGISIELEIVPSSVELVARMRAPDAPPDLLVPPDYAVRELQSAGLLLPLDLERLPNLSHLEARFRKARAHDPDTAVSVPKDWGTTGYLLRSDRVSMDCTSWADFWMAARSLHSGKLSVLDSPGEVIGAALKLRRRSYNDNSQEGLRQARLDLLALRPHVKAFSTDYKPLLIEGEVDLALGWNGDAAALTSQGVPIRYVLPTEGSQIWEDDWCIAKASSHPDEAHTFLDFVLRPEIAAQEALFTGYATPNRSAWERLPDPVRNNSTIYPPPVLLDRLEPGLPHPPVAAQRRAEIWAEFRA